MMPLQLSSMPLQISVPGAPGVSGVHASAASLTQQALEPPEHLFTPPRAQAPTPTEHEGRQKPLPQVLPLAQSAFVVHVQRPWLQVCVAAAPQSAFTVHS